MKTLLFGLLGVLISSVSLQAEDTFLSVEEAGPDYRVQGEYSGDVEVDGQKVRVGLQVIALGGGKFDAVAYPGGLPGDGWNGTDKIRARGTTEGGVTKLTGDG